MRKFILALIITLSSLLTHGQTWIQTSLSDRISINLPSTPEVEEFENVTFYHIAESGYILNVSAGAMNFEIKQDSIQNFYHRVVESAVKAAWAAKVVKERKIYLDNYEGLEIEYTRFFDGISDVLVTRRVILVDNTLFTFDIFDLSGKGQTKLINKLFQSIRLKE